MTTVVRNVRGTALRACTCGSWLNHYHGTTGSKRIVCAILKCGNTVDAGAHVYDIKHRKGTSFLHWIVPMCHAHNMSRDDLPLKGGVVLVSANTQQMECYRPARRKR